MAWRSQMGRVLVGRSLVGRLWHRSLLGIYTRWLGLELSLSVSEAASRTCPFRNPYPGGDSPELWNRGMLAGDGCDPQAAYRGATQLFYVARAA
jgi:hypothetical protein